MSVIPLAQKVTHAILWAAQDWYKELAKLVYFAIAQARLPLIPARVKRCQLISEPHVILVSRGNIGSDQTQMVLVLTLMDNQIPMGRVQPTTVTLMDQTTKSAPKELGALKLIHRAADMKQILFHPLLLFASRAVINISAIPQLVISQPLPRVLYKQLWGLS
jgi:hypothetical protein